MKEVHGEKEGLKKSLLEDLAGLYAITIPSGRLWTEELVEKISALSSQINREIALYLDRKGQVVDVSVGDHQTVSLAQVEGKRNPNRLSGIRCLHTHPGGSGRLSAVDLNSLKVLRLDAMVAIGIRDGRPQEIYAAVLSPDEPDEVKVFGPCRPRETEFGSILSCIEEADRLLRKELTVNKAPQERAIIVGIQTPESRQLNGSSEAEISFAELEELAKTAGALVVGRMMQKRKDRSSATVIGQGKLEELQLMVQALHADLVIMDEELSATQQRNIENVVGCKVLSRTALILDIFAQRARSREGILQVELAQLQYRLPRLLGSGLALSRLGGGIGTRGPGETKLETDRRHIRTRIAHLQQELAAIRRQRDLLRQNRRKNNLPLVSLVGYTNAGKSTLLNALCAADVLAEDKLFATLDTTVRRLPLPSGRTVLLSDTVGFIRKLPPSLLDAFKSTLEEAVLADLILIVADASDPQVEDQIRIVDEILAELEASNKPTIIVFNKLDRLPDPHLPFFSRKERKTIGISARTGQGLDDLKEMIETLLFADRIRLSLLIPYHEGSLLSWLHSKTNVFSESFTEQGTLVTVDMEKSLLEKVAKYRIYN